MKRHRLIIVVFILALLICVDNARADGLAGILAPAKKSKTEDAGAPSSVPAQPAAASGFSFLSPSKKLDNQPQRQTAPIVPVQPQYQPQYQQQIQTQVKPQIQAQQPTQVKPQMQTNSYAPTAPVQNIQSSSLVPTKEQNDVPLEEKLAWKEIYDKTIAPDLKPISEAEKAFYAKQNIKGVNGYPMTAETKLQLVDIAEKLKSKNITPENKRQLVADQIEKLKEKAKDIKIQRSYSQEMYKKMDLPESYTAQLEQDSADNLALIESALKKLGKY